MDEKKIDLKTPFDDDSHTFADGPLQRFFRMCKWFFACSVLLILLGTNWLDWAEIKSAVNAPRLPLSVLQTCLTTIGIYLMAQAGLVLLQLFATYRVELQTRVSMILDERVRALEDEIQRAWRLHSMYSAAAAAAEGDKARGIEVQYMDDEELRIEGMLEQQRALQSESTRRRSLVTVIEILLDLMRIAPSLLFLCYAVIWHGHIEVRWQF